MSRFAGYGAEAVRRIGAVLAVLAVASSALAEAAPPEPEGYRMEAYRAPVPATLAGTTVLDTARAHTMWQSGEAVFVDVLPRPPRPDLPSGTLWRPPVREDIPGSIWLANTGFGALADETRAYFEAALDEATGGQSEAPLVFYCLADCWMSWNAAKRALDLGYTGVFWYPEGTDGWAAAGHPVEVKEPAAPVE